MAASWYLAPSLVQLRSEIDARWPARSKSSDGSIGDASHSARLSDHNPNSRRSVNAIDVTKKGIDPKALIATAIGDYRTNYVIHDRKIYRRKNGFKPEPYTGPSPHTEHVHVSILQNRTAEESRSRWNLPSAGGASPGVPSTGDKPVASKPTTPTPTPPKEDTLSAAEVNQIIDALTARMDAKFRDLQANGFDRAPAQFIAKEVWDQSFVYRGAEKKPTSVKQELADSKSLAMQAVAQNAALAEAQLQLSKTGKIDYVKMGDVVREAIEDTITIGGKK